MKIIIVGGGKLGKDIADNMLERKYDVTEQNVLNWQMI